MSGSGGVVPAGGRKRGVKTGSPGRTRTTDQVINSHLLYRLSYRGIIEGAMLLICLNGVNRCCVTLSRTHPPRLRDFEMGSRNQRCWA